MKEIVMSNEDFEKVQYLLGFANSIAEIVLSPDEYLDPNTGDSTSYSLWCSEDDEGVILSTIDSNDVEEFRNTLAAIENEVRSVVKTDFSNKWKELRG